MKKFLLATTAFVVLAAASANAADLARPAYAPPPPPVYSWTGMYWGVNIGYSWGTAKNDFSLTAPGFARIVSESQNVDGVIGGGQSGYNYQFGAWVWGFETDIQASGQKGGSTFTVLAAPLTTVTTDHKLTWFGTARSRLGFLWSPNVLVYGTAGAAYGQVKDSAAVNLTGVGNIVTANRSDVKAGWTAGGGIEGAFGGGWSAKLEYLYIDLGKLEQTVTLPVAGTSTSLNSRFTDNIVRVGLNYRWGGGGY
jgi:outer membrane immunogenic protein